MTATLDELDTVRSSAPDFGLPPGPEKLTGWDKDRLTSASVPDIHEGKPRPVADVVDGVHLREDQKSLKTVVAELSTEDDLLPLQKKLEEAFELGGSLSGKQRTDATYEIFAAINDLITSRQRDTTGFTPSQMREYERKWLRMKNGWGVGLLKLFKSIGVKLEVKCSIGTSYLNVLKQFWGKSLVLMFLMNRQRLMPV